MLSCNRGILHNMKQCYQFEVGELIGAWGQIVFENSPCYAWHTGLGCIWKFRVSPTRAVRKRLAGTSSSLMFLPAIMFHCAVGVVSSEENVIFHSVLTRAASPERLGQ
jgi:hypothetical protein